MGRIDASAAVEEVVAETAGEPVVGYVADDVIVASTANSTLDHGAKCDAQGVGELNGAGRR